MVNVRPIFPTFQQGFEHHMPGAAPKQECWLWPMGSDGSGYGQLFYGTTQDRAKIRAHVASYRLHHGEIPAGHVVRHSCHNPRCVNPNHLSTGTRADNAQDMVLAGRALDGERAPQAKLTNASVLAIRKSAAAGVTHQALADQYGVSRRTVGHLVNRSTWKHI